ncbi:hypothetical protein QQY66_34425 [Streptomyces sp. DG2A-72]|uniref:hypothetical protein n=1 Tax=Streptomyces sp. DG2A-72 TaxID=3051386 RepID=UPI00265C087C|nr:hypothetical protein [Streptomyces sp. DG2A-72]MDO0936558.1 hypothetical protein [Streptomyces sp. DG2A-72]
MSQTDIPAEAADWVRGHVGRHAAWALPVDLSGARAWRMSSPQGLIDIRVTRTDEEFGREVYAHRHAIRRLGPSHGPRLLASEPRLRSLLTVQPRAWRIDSTALHRLPRVHEDAGQLLRVLHDSVSRAREAHAQAARATALYAQRLRALADHLPAVVPPIHAAAVRRSASFTLEHARELPPAFCHGTFGPANWEWQSQTQTLSLTGFGRSQLLGAVIDFARPALVWAEHPHLRESFLKAYGRALSKPELLVLPHVSVLTSGEDLLHAIQFRDSESISTAAAALRLAVDRNGSMPEVGSPTAIDASERR